MEIHPRIKLRDSSLKTSKIILGSFPTWTLTSSQFDEIRNEKEITRIKNNDIPFFFGSSINKFWNWYYEYVDCKIIINDIKSIKKSLKVNKIGITDVIFSCKRSGKSSLDQHLTSRVYNHIFFEYPKKGKTLKILCTSKGVMNQMLFNKKFFKTHQELKINFKESVNFQNKIVKKSKGQLNNIKKPLCLIINTEIGGVIECVSIPSPGSPYRRLVDFGFDSNDSDKFLDDYLKVAFDWFTE